MRDYPDNGETGETYDIELVAANPGETSKEAIDQARYFFKEQREQNLKRG